MTHQYADYISQQLGEGGMKRVASGHGLGTFVKKPLDPVNQSELQGKHSDRVDPDIDNDGKVTKSDQYLHTRREKIANKIAKKGAARKSNRSAAVATLVKTFTDEPKKYKDRDDEKNESIDESMTVHLKPHPSGTHYVVHKLGSRLKAHGGLKVGEKISDTAVDDLGDSGVKVKHMGEQFREDDYDIVHPEAEEFQMTERTAADSYAAFISNQIQRSDPLRGMDERRSPGALGGLQKGKPLPGEKIGRGTWYGRRKNVTGSPEEDELINKEMDDARKKRTQAWKDKMDKQGAVNPFADEEPK